MTVCFFLFRVALGCPILNGYGQTECAGGCAVSSFHAAEVGVSPLVCSELKVADVPDMNYARENYDFSFDAEF